MGFSTFTMDGLDFVDEAVVAFHTEAAMVMTGEGPKVDFQNGAHLLKSMSKFTISIDDYNGDKAKREDNLFHKHLGKDSGRCISDNGGNDELGEVTHSIEDTYYSLARDSKITREPKIEMNDVERGSDRPGEIHFTLSVAPNVVGDTVSAAFDPTGNVLTHPRPMEP